MDRCITHDLEFFSGASDKENAEEEEIKTDCGEIKTDWLVFLAMQVFL